MIVDRVDASRGKIKDGFGKMRGEFSLLSGRICPHA